MLLCVVRDRVGRKMPYQKLISKSSASILTLFSHVLRKLFNCHQLSGNCWKVNTTPSMLTPPTHLRGHIECDLTLYRAYTVAHCIPICTCNGSKILYRGKQQQNYIYKKIMSCFRFKIIICKLHNYVYTKPLSIIPKLLCACCISY